MSLAEDQQRGDAHRGGHDLDDHVERLVRPSRSRISAVVQVFEAFSFTDAGRPCRLTLRDDTLVFERGSLARRIPWSSLRHLYRHRTGRRDEEGYERLVLGFDDEKGRPTHLLIDATPGDPVVAAAVAAVLGRYPEVDRGALGPDDAYRSIGVSTDRQIFLVVGVLLALATTLTASTSIDRLLRWGGSGYVTVRDVHAEVTAGVRVTRKEATSRTELSSDTWIPLTTSSSPCGPAPYALHLQDPTDAQLLAVSRSTAFSGGREVLWDDPASLADDQARVHSSFHPAPSECAFRFADPVVSFDPAITRRTDLLQLLSRMAIGLALGAGLVMIHAARSRWRTVQAPRPDSPYR